jgi:hypothetical protein
MSPSVHFPVCCHAGLEGDLPAALGFAANERAPSSKTTTSKGTSTERTSEGSKGAHTGSEGNAVPAGGRARAHKRKGRIGGKRRLQPVVDDLEMLRIDGRVSEQSDTLVNIACELLQWAAQRAVSPTRRILVPARLLCPLHLTNPCLHQCFRLLSTTIVGLP